MSAWGFDEDSSARSVIQPSKRDSGGASFQVKKHAFFADDDDSSSRYGEPPGSRRKQSSPGRKELVLDDDDDDLDEQRSQSQQQQSARSSERDDRVGSSKAVVVAAPLQRSIGSLKCAKVDETGIPEVIHTVLRTKVAQPSSQNSSSSSSSASSSANAVSASPANKKRVSIADLSQDTTELLMQYLVREFLKLHVADDAIVGLFEKERPMHAALDEKEATKLFERITGHRDASSRSKSPAGGSTSSDEKPRSLLEQFLVVWNETIHKRKCERLPASSSSRRSSGSSSRQTEAKPESTIDTGVKKKSQDKSSAARKKKPMLNVITASDELDNVDALNNQGGDDDVGVDYNRLNHPGSTPKPQGAAAVASSILGDPGSTPKALASDLKALGFDEEELNTPVPIENTEGLACDDAEEDAADLSSLSEYAKKKRVAKKHSKHVSLGESGSTPTKEYIFFRETPPSFVTETVEAAVDVLEKLGLDPAFRQQAAVPQDKFVELQSSEVSKYNVGQEVQNLGAKRDVSGVVSKIFGSRQCGSSGPGTIVIDTCPGGVNSDLGAASVAAAEPAVSALDNDDEDLMTELA